MLMAIYNYIQTIIITIAAKPACDRSIIGCTRLQ